MESIKMRSHELPMNRMIRSVLIHGGICCVLYIVFMLIMRAAGLIHVTELRFVNYVILCLVCLFEIRTIIKRRETYVPFLQVFSTAFFTGLWSFFLFSIFLFVYAKFDTELNYLFRNQDVPVFKNFPSIFVFFEGSAISIITAFINMQYFRRFEEGYQSAKDLKK
jgi:hypothetical protein